MELRRLTEEELSALYHAEMVYDFPRSELKPLRSMLTMLRAGCYDPLALFEGEELLGYALLWRSQAGDAVLLDYLAVVRPRRGQGIGSILLREVCGRCPSIVLEAEAPDSPDETENAVRRRRLAFYARAGARTLDYDCALFGVHYKCLYLGEETDDRRLQELHRRIYTDHLPSKQAGAYVQLPLREGEEIRIPPEEPEEEEEP